MKVLIVSHNVIGPSTNLGITLTNTFKGFGAENIAQFFVRNEIPSERSVCKTYFRITDKEAMVGVFSRRVNGTEYSENMIKPITTQRPSSKDDAVERIRMLRRNPLMDFGRDLYWSLCPWFSDRLKAWLKTVAPDVVFFTGGDYAFSYHIALRIAKTIHRPLIVASYDDFFYYIKNGDQLLGKLRHKFYMRTVEKTLQYASGIVAICDTMAKDYSERFHKECTVLYTPVDQKNIELDRSGKNIVYFGTMGLGRDDQLVAIGKAVAATAKITGIDHIDVYTSEKRREALDKMTKENGIVCHSAVSRDEMLKILCHSVAVIHTESFDPEICKRVRYSISTKIPEALSYGPCLLAYGPAEIASVAYLKENRIACVITNKDELEQKIAEMLTDESFREQTIKRARRIAGENHNSAINTERLKRCFEAAIQRYQKQDSNT